MAARAIARREPLYFASVVFYFIFRQRASMALVNAGPKVGTTLPVENWGLKK